MSKTVACIYTAPALVDPLKAEFEKTLPDVKMINIVDDTLIFDIINAENITDELEKRTLAYFQAADNCAADAIFSTCSSVGEVADKAAATSNTPVIKIDQAMIEKAVVQCDRLGVIATLNSTLDPTIRFVEKTAAAAGRDVKVVKGLAEGAFQAVISGDAAKHDSLIMEAAKSLNDQVDGFILAQGSMARFAEPLAKETGKKVYSSVESGVEALKEFLAK